MIGLYFLFVFDMRCHQGHRPDPMPEEDIIDNSGDGEGATAPAPKKATKAKKDVPQRTWKNEDIANASSAHSVKDEQGPRSLLPLSLGRDFV